MFVHSGCMTTARNRKRKRRKLPELVNERPCKWKPDQSLKDDGSDPDPIGDYTPCNGVVTVRRGRDHDANCNGVVGHRHHIFSSGSYVYEPGTD